MNRTHVQLQVPIVMPRITNTSEHALVRRCTEVLVDLILEAETLYFYVILLTMMPLLLIRIKDGGCTLPLIIRTYMSLFVKLFVFLLTGM